LRKILTVCARLSSNSRSFCLSLLSAEITGTCYQAQLLSQSF
jgi:hypothetical protein